ncbi:TonB-dependent receptor [Microbulbifer sp. SA54]|uniref:TonB-dependent receptor n=1 Tax=Microbulbifer sp. SA54 TaxID=3401577 RepID=UPI003AAD0467
MRNVPLRHRALAAAIAGLASVAANAQQIEEVTVTAQQREQTLQEVPIAVSAFSDNFMEQANVDDVRGLVALSPGFNGATEDSFSDAMAMRGISTNDFGVGGDPSVAVFMDGVWQGRNGGVQTSFFDVQRAEVVKGPQGTLFGRNAIAGAVSVFTNKPTEEFEGKIQLGAAQFNKREATGTINLPLTDNLYFRGSVYGLSDDGWLENLQGGEDYGFHERSAARAALRYEGERTDATLTLNYEDREQNSSIYWDPEAGLPKNKVNSDLRGRDAIDEGEIFSATANVTVNLSDEYTLTSITGYKTFNFYYLEDYDASPELVNNYLQDSKVDYLSQEVRVNFDDGGDLVWFAGASLYREDIDNVASALYDEDALCRAISRTDAEDFDGEVSGCADPGFWMDYWEADAAPTADELALNKREDTFNEVTASGWAVFADATWSATSQLDLMLGARYTVDRKEMEMLIPDSGGWLGNNFNYEFAVPEWISADDEWSAFTPRVAANYVLSDEISLYANAARGYKTGGFATFGVDLVGVDDDGIALPGSTPMQFDPETVQSFEAGIKSKLLNNSLQANLAIYQYTYEDLQFVYFDNGSQLVENLGEAGGRGAEFDLRYLPSERLDFFFTLSYMDTEITDDSDIRGKACDESGCKGKALPFSPELSTAFIATYRHPLSSGELLFSYEHIAQSKQYSDIDNIELVAQKAWQESNLRLGYQANADWNLTLWVENLFEEQYFERGWANADVNNQWGYGLVNTQVWPSKPRIAGVDFTMQF